MTATAASDTASVGSALTTKDVARVKAALEASTSATPAAPAARHGQTLADLAHVEGTGRLSEFRNDDADDDDGTPF